MSQQASIFQVPKKPPLVKGDPVLGSLRPLLKDPHQLVIKAHRMHGDIFRLKVLNKEMLVLAGEEANRFMSGDTADNLDSTFWEKSHEFMGCPHAILAVDGEVHQWQRKVIQPFMTAKAFSNRIAELAEPVEMAINETRGKTDVGPFLRKVVSNQLGMNLQGYRTSYKEVEELIYYFGSVFNVFSLGKWPRFMLETPRFKRAEAQVKKHTRKIITLADARTEEERLKQPLLFDDLLPGMRERPEWFSQGDIDFYALFVFVAALDTVGATMGFLLRRLLMDPALKQRVQKEVDAVFSQGLPDIKSLRGMEDLNGLVKETLRLHPTGFGVTRSAAKDFEFQGYRVRKGQNIMVFTTAGHNKEEFFPEPEKFDIERYREPRNEHRQSAYAPFAKGPHNCLGASLADIMMPLDVGLILYHLDIEPACNMKKVRTVFNPAPVLSDNFRIKVKARNHLPS